MCGIQQAVRPREGVLLGKAVGSQKFVEKRDLLIEATRWEVQQDRKASEV